MRLFILLFAFSSCFSQGGNNLRVEYNETITFIPQMAKRNLSRLYVLKDYSCYVLESSKIERKGSTSNSDAIIVDTKVVKDFSEIIIDLKEKKLTERLSENIFLKKKYSVCENLTLMKWKILDGEKKIKNYICKNAQITFRGKTYTAWYTEKIPVSIGPWKFNGLPGLILLVSDNEGYYKWDAKSITYPYNGKEIDFKKTINSNPNFPLISFKDFDKKRIDAIQNKIEIIRARNSGREGMRVGGYSYSTFQEKEPINEWRTKKDFD